METFTPRMKGILLECEPQQVPLARHAIRDSLSAYARDVVDLVEQCASETMANAVVHSDAKHEDGAVMVVIVELQDRIRIEVIDDGSEHKTPRLNDDMETACEGGRGLFLVEAMSDAWGTHVDEFGANVWFEVKFT